MAVLGVERLVFLAIVPEEEAAIGQDTVDVEDDKTNLAGFFIEVLHGVVLCCSGGHFLSKLSLIFGLHQLFSIDFRILLAETAEDDALEARYEWQQVPHGNVRRLLLRIAIDAGADGREGNRAHLVEFGELHGVSVAIRQQPGFMMIPALPDGADRVDDPFRCQPEARRDAGLAGRAAVELPGTCQQLGSCCAVYGTIDTAAAEQAVVGGIDDGVRPEPGDVADKHLGDGQVT